MDELVGNEASAVNDIDGKQLLKRGSSNMHEMLIPGDVNVEENTMGLYLDVLDGKNVARVDTSAHACTSPRCVNDSGAMVEELTVKSYDSGNLKIDASNMKGKMHNKWQHLNQRAEGKITRVWEDSGSTIFPELMNNNNQQIENQNDTIDLSRREDKQPASGNTLLSPGGIRTKILSQSGFSQYFVKNTLKGKGVICNGPVHDAHIRGQNHPSAGLIDSNSAPDSSKETNVDDSLSLREWLKTGQNKVDKSKSLYVFKQILDLVDSSHSQGVALQALRPSCFKLMPSNQVLYLGSPLQKEFMENNGSEKRHDPVLGVSQSSKRRKHGDNQSSFRRWPQFSRQSGNVSTQDSGYGFNGESIPKRSNTHTIQSMSNSLLHVSPTSRFVANFGADALEEQWYASPEDPKGMCATSSSSSSSSNVYSLGVLLFELLGSFESARAHDIAMMDLRQRILPPTFLSENPQEAGFCLWLLHPEPSLRPTTRDIQQSQLVSGIQQSSIKELSSSITQEDAESDLMLHFLASLKEQKQKCGTKLVEEVRCLESDILEIKSRQPNNSLAFPNLKLKPSSSSSHGGSRLITNMNHLEHAYFSVRSTVKNPDYDTEEHGVLTSRENNNKKMEATAADKKPSDRLGVFFNGLCKYARYSNFEVKGILRNGDFSNMGNVICSLGFDRDEDYFATAGVSKKIKVYDFEALLNTSVDIHYPAVEMSNKSKISCICWNNYIRNYLASTDYDGVVKIWDAGTGEAVSHHMEHERRTWSVDFSRADPMKLASGSDDCCVKLWSINEKKSLATIRSAANVCSVQFSPYSSHLLCFGSADYRTYCYDLRNISTPLCTLTGHDRAVSFVKFLDPGTLISASTDNTLKLWDLNKANFASLSTSSCILTFKGHTNEKNFVGLSVADGYIACGSETNEVFAYYRSLPIPITSHKFGSIDPISGKETENETNQFVSSVCWRQKSEMVVAANSSGCLKLLQML